MVFKTLVENLLKYNQDQDNTLALNYVNTLKRELRNDLIQAYQLSEPLVKRHNSLFWQSNSFLDFLIKLCELPSCSGNVSMEIDDEGKRILEQENRNLKDKQTRNQDDIKRLEEENQDLKYKLSITERKLSDCHHHLESLKHQNAEMKRETTHWKDMYNGLKEEYTNFKSQNDEVQRQLNECMSQLNAAKQHNSDIDSDEDSDEEDDYSQIISYLKERYQTDDEEQLILTLQKELAALESLKNENQKIQSIKAECAQLNSAVDKYVGKIDEMQKVIMAQNEEYVDLSEKYRIQKDETANCLSELETKRADLEDCLEDLSSEEKKALDHLKRCQEDLKQSFFKTEELEKQRNKLSEKQKTDQLEIAQLKEQLQDFLKKNESSLTEAESKIAQLEKKNKILEDELLNKNNQIRATQSALRETAEKWEKELQANKDLCMELDDEKMQQNEELTNCLTKLGTTEAELQSCLSNASSKEQSLLNDLKTYQDKLRECLFKKEELEKQQTELLEKLKNDQLKIAQLNEQLQNLFKEDESKVPQNMILQLQEENNKLENELLMKTNQIITLQSTLAETVEKLEYMKKELENRNNMYEELNKQCENQNDKIKNNLKKLEEKDAELEDCLDNEQKRSLALKTCREDLEECFSRKKEIEKKQTRLSRKLKTDQRKIARLTKQLGNLTEKDKIGLTPKKPKNVTAELQKKIKDLEDEQSLKITQITDLNEKLNNVSKIMEVLQKSYGNREGIPYYLEKDLNELSIYRGQANDLQRKIDWVNVEPIMFADAVMQMCENKTQYLTKIAKYFNIPVDDDIVENIIQITEDYKMQIKKWDSLLERLSWNEDFEGTVVRKLVYLRNQLGDDWLDYWNNVYSKMLNIHNRYFSNTEFKKWVDNLSEQIEEISGLVIQRNINTENWFSDTIRHYNDEFEKCNIYEKIIENLVQLTPDLSNDNKMNWANDFTNRYNNLLQTYKALEDPDSSPDDFYPTLTHIKSLCVSINPEIGQYSNWLYKFIKSISDGCFTPVIKKGHELLELEKECENLANYFGISFRVEQFQRNIIESPRMKQLISLEQETLKLGSYFSSRAIFSSETIIKTLDEHFKNIFEIPSSPPTKPVNIQHHLDYYVQADRKKHVDEWNSFFKECSTIIEAPRRISKEQFKNKLIELKDFYKSQQETQNPQSSKLKKRKGKSTEHSIEESDSETEQTLEAPGTTPEKKIKLSYKISQQEIQSLFLGLYRKLFECKAQLWTNINLNVDYKTIIDNKLKAIEVLEQENVKVMRKHLIFKIYQDYVKLDLETVVHKEPSKLALTKKSLLDTCETHTNDFLKKLINNMKTKCEKCGDEINEEMDCKEANN